MSDMIQNMQLQVIRTQIVKLFVIHHRYEEMIDSSEHRIIATIKILIDRQQHDVPTSSTALQSMLLV